MLNSQSRNTIIRKPKRISLMQHKIKIRNEKFYNFVTFLNLILFLILKIDFFKYFIIMGFWGFGEIGRAHV
jgi:hypothetical protein